MRQIAKYYAILGKSSFSPLDLSPALWLDASDTATITASLGSVSQWDDKSGNGRNVTQGTAAAQPTTGSATQNGLNALSFDGADALHRSTTLSLGPDNTVVVVASPSSGTQDYLLALIAVIGQRSIITKYNSQSYEWYQAEVGIFTRFTLGASGLSGVNTLIAVKSGNNVTSLVNGSSSGSASGAGTTTLDVATTVGASDSNGVSGAAATICEVIVYTTAITGDDLTNLSDYLRDKWGTP
jgi:hypothetical protein